LNSSVTAPVVAGLAAGIAFVLLFSTFFAQAYTPPFPEGEYHPRPGRIADQAVKIAMGDSTIQLLFEGREIAVTSVRDWGVAMGSECPIGWCATILFDDNSDDIIGFAAVTVNVKSARVIDISLHEDILIQRANDTREAKYFVSKYPDARVDVIRDRTKATVSYSVTRQVGEPPDSIERKRVLAIFFDKVNLMVEPSEFRLYCIDGLSTPAIGGDIVGRIDNEGCFGK
jgi:hypothetical protein